MGKDIAVAWRGVAEPKRAAGRGHLCQRRGDSVSYRGRLLARNCVVAPIFSPPRHVFINRDISCVPRVPAIRGLLSFHGHNCLPVAVNKWPRDKRRCFQLLLIPTLPPPPPWLSLIRGRQASNERLIFCGVVCYNQRPFYCVHREAAYSRGRVKAGSHVSDS